jgi:hypothetical protein
VCERSYRSLQYAYNFSVNTQRPRQVKRIHLFFIFINSLIFFLPEYTALHPSCLGDSVIFQSINIFLFSTIRLLLKTLFVSYICNANNLHRFVVGRYQSSHLVFCQHHPMDHVHETAEVYQMVSQIYNCYFWHLYCTKLYCT